MQTLLLALPPDVSGPGGSPGGGGMGGIMLFILPLLLLFILMPLFNKKEKRRRARIQTIKKHDKVVTAGGVYGTITAMDEVAVTLEIARDVRIRVKRSSIFDIDSPQEAKAKEAERGAKKAGAKA